MLLLALRSFRLCFLGLITNNFCSGSGDFKKNWWEDDRDQAKIFGDDGPARIAEFPFIISIVHRPAWSVNEKLMCSGISTGLEYKKKYAIVITSGTCINHFVKFGIQPEDVIVRTNSEFWDCPCGITKQYKILQWRLHPEYQEHIIPFDGAISINDIAMVVLDRPWEGYYNMMALALPLILKHEFPPRKMRASIAGWGYTKTSKTTQKELREAKNLLILSPQSCRHFYREFFPDNSFCVANEHMPVGPCVYDHGGPVIFRHPYLTILKTYLLGIIATSPRCGDSRKPAIILNITKYIPFIQNVSWIVDHPKKKNETSGLTPPYRCVKNAKGKIRCCKAGGTCVDLKPESDSKETSGSWSWSQGKHDDDDSEGEAAGGWGNYDTSPNMYDYY